MTKTHALCKPSASEMEAFRKRILGWYDAHARALAWRALPGERAEPYHVWLSEIMLQQTTVQAVKPYYETFLRRWPNVQALAEAPREEVMSAWAGLGYYARARNLHKCAQIVASELNGVFPDTQEELKKLPGIGDYTSAAIAAIAFNKPATVVDGNIERIAARYFAMEDPLPASKPKLKALAGYFFDGEENRPGDLAQALMDLGAGICIPKAPRCALCPVQEACAGRISGIAGALPRREKKKPRPQKYGEVYWIENGRGDVLFHRRPEKGLLGGMTALPTSAWEQAGKGTDVSETPDFVVEAMDWDSQAPLSISHVFTHFDLELRLKSARLTEGKNLPPGYFWDQPSNCGDSLPSVFEKAFALFSKS